jgi:hypothetical protein
MGEKMRNVAFGKRGKRISSYKFYHRKFLFVGVNSAKASMVWTCPKNGRGDIAKRSYEMASTRTKKTR